MNPSHFVEKSEKYNFGDNEYILAINQPPKTQRKKVTCPIFSSRKLLPKVNIVYNPEISSDQVEENANEKALTIRNDSLSILSKMKHKHTTLNGYLKF